MYSGVVVVVGSKHERGSLGRETSPLQQHILKIGFSAVPFTRSSGQIRAFQWGHVTTFMSRCSSTCSHEAPRAPPIIKLHHEQWQCHEQQYG